MSTTVAATAPVATPDNLPPPSLATAWISAAEPELLRAQYFAYLKQIPAMYLLVLANIIIFVREHFVSWTSWVFFYIPGIFATICVVRFFMWLRLPREQATLAFMHRTLARTTLLSWALAVAFVSWTLYAFLHSAPEVQIHVLFFVAITIVGVLFCLMQVWQAVLGVLIMVNFVFGCFVLWAGNKVFAVMGTHLIAASVILSIILLFRYRNFSALVRERQASEVLAQKNLELTLQDGLTGLPNRTAFFQALQQSCQTARERVQASVGQRAPQRPLAVAIIDLAGFKPINDLRGHITGDRLLIQAGQRMEAIIAGQGKLARLGGDEFALLMHSMPDDAACVALAETLSTALHEPFVVDGTQLQLGAAIGIAIYPGLVQQAEDLHLCAGHALHQAKREKKAGVHLFSHVHQERIQRVAQVEQALRGAHLERELSVWFQPIVDMKARSVVGMEALARWNSPTLGAVSPAEFIPVAENSGQVARLTRELLRQALLHAAQWPEDVYLSFNLSVHDLTSTQEMAHICHLLGESNIPPARIQLEMTETAATQDMECMRKVITALNEKGYGVVLDDLGTGFSSLGQLLVLPLKKIKIDRRFAQGIDRKPNSRKIVASLLSLGRDMGLACVIEGVETREELRTLAELGATQIQGYVYAQPMPADKVHDWLQAQSWVFDPEIVPDRAAA